MAVSFDKGTAILIGRAARPFAALANLLRVEMRKFISPHSNYTGA
jgi:hypothetical protein